MTMFVIFIFLLPASVISYVICLLDGDVFEKPYNNHIFHVSLLFVSILGLFFSSFSPTANRMWQGYESDVGIIRKTLEIIEQNISDYSFSELKFSDVNNNCTLKFVHKATGDEHSIYIDNSILQEYIHWYKNGKLVVRNGIKDEQEYPAFHEDIHVCTVINGYIFEKVEDIVNAAKRFKTSQNLGNVSLLTDTPPTTKTLELTAPAESTITGTVSEQGQIIHTETL